MSKTVDLKEQKKDALHHLKVAAAENKVLVAKMRLSNAEKKVLAVEERLSKVQQKILDTEAELEALKSGKDGEKGEDGKVRRIKGEVELQAELTKLDEAREAAAADIEAAEKALHELKG
jgi:predicted  nucleic acid-binding Zn-ribbon protein